MKAKHRWVIGVLATGAFAFLTILFLDWSSTPQPLPLTYLEQPADYWLAKVPMTIVPTERGSDTKAVGFATSHGQNYGSANPNEVDGITAFKAMGTNALPYLLGKLQGTDNVLERALTKAAAKTSVPTVPFRLAELERLQAVTALIALEHIPTEAHRTLVESSNGDQTNEIARSASFILKRRATLKREDGSAE